MKCPVCGAQNDEGTAFCYQCGSALRPGNAEPATGRTVMLGSDPLNQPPIEPTSPPNSSNVYGSAPQTRHDARTYDVPSPQPTLQTSIPPSPSLPTAQSPYLVTSVQSSSSQTSTLAVFALVLGILTWSFLPVLAGLPAVITGHMARREIARSGGRLAGGGLALTGLILGYLSIMAAVAACAFFTLVLRAA